MMILEQKFFKDKKNNIFCLDIIESNKNTWSEEVKKGWISITEEEAKLILNPPLTPEEIEAQKELQKQQKIFELEAEKRQLTADMQMHLLLDEKAEAKEIAQKLKAVNLEIEKLKS